MSRDRNYECKECGKEYPGYSTRTKRRISGKSSPSLPGAHADDWITVCPKGHEVKLIPQTKAPCPLCKESSWNRDVNKVCNNCQKEIERLREFEKHNIAARGPMNLYWASSSPCFEYHTTYSDRERLSKAFTNLLFLLGQKPPTDTYEDRYKYSLIPLRGIINEHSDLAADRLLAFHPEVAKVIQEIFDATNLLTNANYKAGIEEGKNVIYQLATGGMSLKELQEHDIKHARQVQKPRRKSKA